MIITIWQQVIPGKLESERTKLRGTLNFQLARSSTRITGDVLRLHDRKSPNGIPEEAELKYQSRRPANFDLPKRRFLSHVLAP